MCGVDLHSCQGYEQARWRNIRTALHVESKGVGSDVSSNIESARGAVRYGVSRATFFGACSSATNIP